MTRKIESACPGAATDERLSALMSNRAAVNVVASAVADTLGPKGLNCMLVDRYGDVTLTNDGSTILDRVDVSHPASRMLIHMAKAQEREAGDGTTTATLLAAALIDEGANHVARGVPVTKVMEGIRLGVSRAVEWLETQVQEVDDVDDPRVRRAAWIAGRGADDIADLVVEAARAIGRAKLAERGYRLADAVVAREGAENEVVAGLILERQRLNPQMPREARSGPSAQVRVLVIDDALAPEELDAEALGTEAGFRLWQQIQQEFADAMGRMAAAGIGLVVVSGKVDDMAEEALTERQAMAVRRVSARDIARVAEHTGARIVKRTILRKPAAEVLKAAGVAKQVYEDEKLEHIRILGGAGQPTATILVGAATSELRAERERIAKDAASAVQAALLGGLLAGGGAAEVAAAIEVDKLRAEVSGMAAYGLDCVVAALKRPLSQIVQNAGFNPLEKIEDVISAQMREGNPRLGVDCDTGAIVDMMAEGIVDAAPVKIQALKSAAEVADAILRINTIIRRKEAPDGREEMGDDGQAEI